MISSSNAAESGSASVSVTRSPRRWRRTWTPTSGKPGPKGCPPRSSSEAAPLLRGRSLPPGRPNGGSSPYRPTEGTHAADHSPSCVHRPCRDHSDRCSAAARDREPKVSLVASRTRTHFPPIPQAFFVSPASSRRVVDTSASAAAPVEWILLFLAIVALGVAAWLWSNWGRSRPPTARRSSSEKGAQVCEQIGGRSRALFRLGSRQWLPD